MKPMDTSSALDPITGAESGPAGPARVRRIDAAWLGGAAVAGASRKRVL